MPATATAPRESPHHGVDFDAPVQPTKLFIGGISRRTTTKQLRDHFSREGRVLDCVAMRQPDGRPRGFGYVTLDSPAAAERFLREPQVIDDRIVDMKLAVPENPAKASSTPTAFYQALAAPSLFGPTWSQEPGFYCDGGLGGVVVPDIGAPGGGSVLDGLQGVGLFGRQSPSMAAMCGRDPPPLDCVDLLTGGMPARPFGPPGLDLPMVPPPQQEPPRLLRDRPVPAPLGELTNIMNCMGTGADHPYRSRDQKYPQPSPQLPFMGPPSPLGEAILTPYASTKAGEPCFIYEDPVEISPTAAAVHNGGTGDVEEAQPVATSWDSIAAASTSATAPASPPSSASADSSPLAPAAVVAEAVLPPPSLESMPSIGSAQHAEGGCRRCNFFAKGRCRNGYDCVFCHLPHDRRKLSRQEKREQQAARLAMQAANGGVADENGDLFDDSDDGGDLPTGPSTPAASEHPMLPSSEMLRMAAAACAPAMPPGLVHPFAASPLAAAAAAASWPGSLLPPAAEAWTGSLLPPVAADPASGLVVGQLRPTSVPERTMAGFAVAGGAVLATSPQHAAAAALAPPPGSHISLKETCSVATQTEEGVWCPRRPDGEEHEEVEAVVAQPNTEGAEDSEPKESEQKQGDESECSGGTTSGEGGLRSSAPACPTSPPMGSGNDDVADTAAPTIVI